jgi:4-hydroxy-2-oxoheptanedioate aldolase
MRKSKIKVKLARNEPVLVPQFCLNDPSVFELASLMGFDGIWLDLEHYGFSVETAQNLMRAARVGGADIVARPAKGEFMRMARLLESGAQGIIYPRCDDAVEAAEVVKWAKFAPMGKRGFDGGNPDMPYCTMSVECYIKEANEETFIVIQIEDQHALDNVEAIANLEGVDVLFLGPFDFSILSGIPGQFEHSLVQEAIRKVAEAASKAGKHWGMPCGTIERVRQVLAMGGRFLYHGVDFLMVKSGLEQLQKQLSPLGFRFDNRLNAADKSFFEQL